MDTTEEALGDAHVSTSVQAVELPELNGQNGSPPKSQQGSVGDKLDPVSVALIARKQPLMELVDSEESYVRRLRMVRDCYIPVISSSKNQSTLDGSLPGPVSNTQISKDLPVLASNLPVMPDDLVARWRILWGNWIQLCEWHSAFLENLRKLVDTDPDKIPRLFIDSRSRLRTIYSKYCENHRKAALIADQHRDYFEDLRSHLGDKEDVVSYLIQPVQRIMRYQLPMAEIVKFTERAQLPDLPLWQKALDIMKEIPKDTQLILEAARIDGFPGVITALGNILIRGNLLVATSTREQLLEAVSGYKAVLQENAKLLGIADSFMPSSKVSNVRIQSGRLASPTTPIATTDPNSPSLSLPTLTDPSHLCESSGLYLGNLKFVESRVFLFEQMLVITEEVKPKRRAVSSEAFAQSTFQFKIAINVNKMRFEPHWYNCSLPNGLTNADAAAVDQLLSLGIAPDDLRFAVQDQTPGRDFVHVIDPATLANRESWVVQLRDIQRMQHEFLLALQDPRRFNTGNRDDTWDISSSTDSGNLPPHSDALPPLVAVHKDVSIPPVQHRQRQQKWPSFTMRRPNRLGSTSSSNTKKESLGRPPASAPPSALTEPSAGHSSGGLLSRSLSAERGSLVHPKPGLRPIVCDSKVSSTGDSTKVSHRKSSLDIMGHSSVCELSNASNPYSETKGSGNVTKMRSVFANLFGRNKTKRRSKTSSFGHQALDPAQPPVQSPRPGVDELDNSSLQLAPRRSPDSDS